ncbi:MAG: hypothetical protein CVU23_00990 [Betaproteobacteria bacterium HGW-Betaproteobacteria-17]|nr:MAG: hypothetical protein CVU23_00990 [Betaproteobacteria bacterium HGW-Betaproteobacteria-17]
MTMIDSLLSLWMAALGFALPARTFGRDGSGGSNDTPRPRCPPLRHGRAVGAVMAVAAYVFSAAQCDAVETPEHRG